MGAKIILQEIVTMSDAQELFRTKAKAHPGCDRSQQTGCRFLSSPCGTFSRQNGKGITVKEVMYNPQLMFDLWVECMLHFKPDLADNPYPLRGFGPLLEILDFQHLKWAGHGVGDDMTYQFVELEVMKADEYDHFLFDPSDFMVRRFWPRVNKAFAPV